MRSSVRHTLSIAAILLGMQSLQAAPIDLLSPAAGARYEPGDTMIVQWTVDFSRILNGVMVQISPNGRLFLTLDGQEQGTIKHDNPAYTGNQGTFRWVVRDSVPNAFDMPVCVVSDSCRVKVYAPYDRDSLGGWPSALSAGQFSIVEPAAMGARSAIHTTSPARVGMATMITAGTAERWGMPGQGGGKLYAVDGSLLGYPGTEGGTRSLHLPGRQPLVLDSRPRR